MMGMLSQFPPTTEEIGFFAIDLQTLVDALVDWNVSLFAARGASIRSRRVDAPLERVLLDLLPLESPVGSRELILETASKWCAVVDNERRGTDVAGALHHLGREVLRCPTALAVASAEGGSPERERVRFDYDDGDKVERSIACLKDGPRWVFETVGDPLPFEEPDHYRARRVRDRFPRDLLARYLRAIGIDAFNPEFFSPGGCAGGVLVEVVRPKPDNHVEFMPAWADAR